MRTDEVHPDGESPEDRARAKRSEYNRRYREKNRDSLREQQKAWRENNRDSVYERQKIWREANKDSLAQYYRDWRAANPDAGRENYKRNRDKIVEQQRAYYLLNAEKIKERNRGYAARPESKLKARRRMLASKYGLSVEEYTARGDALHWRCQSCGDEPNQLGLVVDHNHTDGSVRGLLCSRCNSGLGLLGDSLTKVLALVEYLHAFDKNEKDAEK